jgi:pyruvate/2-oxoglutarate dehydrogenase complex dihydrolipoamide acyltransferase (E2) component
MLQAMQQPVETATSPTSFAGFLAALAEPEKRPDSPWGGDGLEDDIATLSYERALRAHGRIRGTDASDYSPAQTAASGQFVASQAPAAAAARPVQTAAPQSPAAANAGTQPAAAFRPYTALDRDLKCASITIRLSKAEGAQLRQRAAEAGLTVSAYLRSCTFEAETLRALVKDTLAQLRSATSASMPPAPAPPRYSWRQGLTRFFAPWQGRRRRAGA